MSMISEKRKEMSVSCPTLNRAALGELFSDVTVAVFRTGVAVSSAGGDDACVDDVDGTTAPNLQVRDRIHKWKAGAGTR